MVGGAGGAAEFVLPQVGHLVDQGCVPVDGGAEEVVGVEGYFVDEVGGGH